LVGPALFRLFYWGTKILCFGHIQRFKQALLSHPLGNSFSGIRTRQEAAEVVLQALQAAFPQQEVTLLLVNPSTEMLQVMPSTQQLSPGVTRLLQIIPSPANQPVLGWLPVGHPFVQRVFQVKEPANLHSLLKDMGKQCHFPIEHIFLFPLPRRQGVLVFTPPQRVHHSDSLFLQELTPLLEQTCEFLEQAATQEHLPQAFRLLSLLSGEIQPQRLVGDLGLLLGRRSNKLASLLGVTVEVWWRKGESTVQRWICEGSPFCSEDVLVVSEHDRLPYWFVGSNDGHEHLPPALRHLQPSSALLWLPISQGILLLHATEGFLLLRQTYVFESFLSLAHRWSLSIDQTRYAQVMEQTSQLLHTILSEDESRIAELLMYFAQGQQAPLWPSSWDQVEETVRQILRCHTSSLLKLNTAEQMLFQAHHENMGDAVSDPERANHSV
jgi:hypothetical protein